MKTKVWILLAGDGGGVALPLQLRLQQGVTRKSINVRLTGDFPSSSDVFQSCKHGAEHAYELLWNEAYERKAQRVTYSIEGLDNSFQGQINIEGRSADLAFALGLIGETIGNTAFPVLAATGCLGEHGEVLNVEKVPDKIMAALSVLPENAVMVYPADSDAGISPELRMDAVNKGIRLLPVSRLDEAASSLGVEIKKVYLDSPFRGLEKFEFNHASLFFGREKEVESVSSLLLEQSSVLVFGASGSGKSSLVQAGVLLSLVHRYAKQNITLKWAVFNPGSKGSVEDWKPSLQFSWGDSAIPSDLTNDISANTLVDTANNLSVSKVQLVFVLDQLEELFTQDYTPDQIEQFIKYLSSLQAANIVIIATMRNDYYAAYQDSDLSEVFGGKKLFNLQQPSNIELAQIIERPAELAGLVYEEKHGVPLSMLLREDAAKEPGVLPLLEFTLTELYELRNKQTKELTYAAYEDMGGIKGSIGRVAERVFLELSEQEQLLMPCLFRGLTTWSDDSSSFVAKSISLSEESIQPLLNVISKYSSPKVRLLVNDVYFDTPIVKISHEALITHWERAAKWLVDDLEFLKWHARAVVDSKLWKSDSKTKDRLLAKGKPLSIAESFLTSRKEDIDTEVRTYIMASLALNQSKKRISLSVFMVVLALFASLSFWAIDKKNDAVEAMEESKFQAERAKEKKRLAEINQARFIAEKASNALIDGNYDNAILLALNSLPNKFDNDAQPLVGQAMTTLAIAAVKNKKRAIFRHLSGVLSLDVSEDGKSLITLTEGGLVAVWSTESAKKLYSYQNQSLLVSPSFSPSSELFVTVTNKGVLDIRSTLTGESVVTWSRKPYDAALSQVTFNPNNNLKTLLAKDSVGMAKLLSYEPSIKIQEEKLAEKTAFSKNGKMLYFITEWDDAGFLGRLSALSGGITVWDIKSDKKMTFGGPKVLDAVFTDNNEKLVFLSEGKIQVFDVHSESIQSVSIDVGFEEITLAQANSKYISAISASSNSVTVWSLKTGKEVGWFPHDGAINKVQFSPDGDYLISASNDKKTSIWSLETGKKISSYSHDEGITDLELFAVSDNSGFLYTSSLDNTVAQWELGSHKISSSKYFGHRSKSGVNVLDFSFDGDEILIASLKGGIDVWAVDENNKEPKFHIVEDGIFDSYFAPKDSFIVTESLANGTGLWSRKSGELIKYFKHPAFMPSVLSPQGDSILIIESPIGGIVHKSVKTKGIINSFPHDSYITTMGFSPKGEYVVTASKDKRAFIWDSETGEKLITLYHPRNVETIKVSNDSKYIITASKNNVWLWQIDSSDFKSGLSHKSDAIKVDINDLAEVGNVSFSQDGRSILVSEGRSDGKVFIWSLESKEVLYALKKINDQMIERLSANGKIVLYPSSKNVLRLWDLEKKEGIMEFDDKFDGFVASPIGSHYLSQSASLQGGELKESIYPNVVEFARKSLPLNRLCFTLEEREKHLLFGEPKDPQGC